MTLNLNAEFFARYKVINLVDMHYILYRGFFSKPHLEYNGKKTGQFVGLYELCLSLYDMFHEDKDTCTLFVADDVPHMRKKIFPEYKITDARKKVKDKAPVMYVDHDNFKSIIHLFPRFYFVKKDGYEADDIIQHVVLSYHEKGKTFRIYTKDYDLFYLAKRHRVMFYSGVTTAINVAAAVKKKYNTQLAKLPMIKILNGDKSDNVPPVFDLRKTRKIVEQWVTDKKISLFNDELKAKQKEIKRNYLLIQPLKVKELVIEKVKDELSALKVIHSCGLAQLLIGLNKRNLFSEETMAKHFRHNALWLMKQREENDG
jgi:hypothetical protein